MKQLDYYKEHFPNFLILVTGGNHKQEKYLDAMLQNAFMRGKVEANQEANLALEAKWLEDQDQSICGM